MRRSDSPSPVPPHFVGFVWRYRGCTRISFPRSPSASAPGLELVTRYLRPGPATEAKGPPRFLGNPRERALFSDPGGIVVARPLRRHDAAFRCLKHVGSRDNNHFEAQSHGPFTRCLRFAVGVAPSPRKTRFRLLASVAGRGWLPAGFHRKVSAFASSFPKLSWRTQAWFLVSRSGATIRGEIRLLSGCGFEEAPFKRCTSCSGLTVNSDMILDAILPPPPHQENCARDGEHQAPARHPW
jgi:hypothetical protein